MPWLSLRHLCQLAQRHQIQTVSAAVVIALPDGALHDDVEHVVTDVPDSPRLRLSPFVVV